MSMEEILQPVNASHSVAKTVTGKTSFKKVRESITKKKYVLIKNPFQELTNEIPRCDANNITTINNDMFPSFSSRVKN